MHLDLCCVSVFWFLFKICVRSSFISLSLSIDPYSSICAHIYVRRLLTIYVCMHRHAYWTGREVLYSVAFASTCNLKPELYKLKHVFVVVHLRLLFKIYVCMSRMCCGPSYLDLVHTLPQT